MNKELMKDKIKVIISGGGTGGHIFPAISIADAIKRRFPDADILFVGANNRMEMERVPKAGYNIIGLNVVGFDRKKLWKNISVLWKVYKSLNRAKKIIKDFKPDIAIGVGGYASGPILKKANSLGIPTLIQEQNSYAGVTNKLLARDANKICVSYENMEKFFPADRIVITGNPCRKDLLNDQVSKEEASIFFGLDSNKKTILVIGGSLGSKTINNSVSAGLELFTEKNIQIIWQCGKYYLFDLKVETEHKSNPENIKIFDFISRMDLAYKMADLVISRAGASSISELSLLGKPAILIPSPNVSEDHQTKNAMALVEKDAAILINDKDAEENLAKVAIETIFSENKLTSLANNISKLAHRDSDERIVDEVVKIIESRKNNG